jgi:small subunit ribosomal protein S20
VANIKSQIKRNRQNDKRRLRNRVYRGTARIAVRSARTAIDTGVPESKAALISAISALDKAAEQGVLHRNNAARRKSRLMKAFAKMEPVKVEAGTAMVTPVTEPESTASLKGKKAAPRKRTAKAEPKVEVSAEVKPETKKASAKKATATASPKGKKEPAKKPAKPAKKPAAKKKA